jgi:hypothetical protein
LMPIPGEKFQTWTSLPMPTSLWVEETRNE